MSVAVPRRKHILVVDDTDAIIELFYDIIEAMGHRVTAKNVVPADLAEVTKTRPDLVILDILMGRETSGWQLAQKMRMSPATETIPVVICTAATDAVREHEGWLAAHSIKVMPKPFALEDLERAVNGALAPSELMAQRTA